MENVIGIQELKDTFECYDTKHGFNLYEINQILDAHTGVSQDENNLKVLVDDLKKIVDQNNYYKIITCVVSVGKSKKPIQYEFLANTFIRIENNYLILSNDERRLELFKGHDLIIRKQMNNED